MRLLCLLAVAVFAAACSPEGGVIVRDAWARPAAAGANGAVYFVIENGSSDSLELTGGTAEIAEAVELHQSQMEGDVMQMRHVVSVPLAPGAAVTFEPGGLHLMLVGLKRSLQPGDQITVTLHLKNEQDLQLPVTVMESNPSHEGHSPDDH